MVADILGQKHNQGVALVPDSGRGSISDGCGAIVIFDLKTNDVRGTVAAQPDTDGIIFDEASGLVLVVSGDNGVLIEALFPVALHQDPRYFTKERGGFWRRTGYAISREVVTRSGSVIVCLQQFSTEGRLRWPPELRRSL